jgi:hypothetical protein
MECPGRFSLRDDRGPAPACGVQAPACPPRGRRAAGQPVAVGARSEVEGDGGLVRPAPACGRDAKSELPARKNRVQRNASRPRRGDKGAREAMPAKLAVERPCQRSWQLRDQASEAGSRETMPAKRRSWIAKEAAENPADTCMAPEQSSICRRNAFPQHCLTLLPVPAPMSPASHQFAACACNAAVGHRGSGHSEMGRGCDEHPTRAGIQRRPQCRRERSFLNSGAVMLLYATARAP